MSDEVPRKRSFIVKTLIVVASSAVGLLLAAGFCGLDAHLYPNSEFGGSALAGIGAGLGVLSVAVLVASVIVLVIAGLARVFRKND